MMGRILLALQYWGGDKYQAMELARLIADIEPTHCSAADFLFVHRFDCKPDESTMNHVGRKFNVHKYRSPRRETGWPDGCNGLWYSTMEWVYHMIEAKKIPAYKAVLTFEADCVPLRRDWINYLSERWDELAKGGKVFIAGRKVESVGVHEHINGNAFFSCDLNFLKWVVKGTRVPPGVGWDYHLAGEFRRRGWAEIPGLECRWGTKTLTDEFLREELERGVVFLHGVKDRSALTFSRKHLLT